MDYLKVLFLFVILEAVHCKYTGQISGLQKRLRRNTADVGGTTDDDVGGTTDDDVRYRGESVGEGKPKRRNHCCEIGSFLAQSRYNCLQKPFHRADLHSKLHLVKTLPGDIGVDVSEASQTELFSHFRKCVLKKAHEVDKCCSAYSQRRGDSAGFDYSTNIKTSTSHRASRKCDTSSEDWPRCRHFSKQHNSSAHARTSRHFQHNGERKKNYSNKWSRYLNLRSHMLSNTWGHGHS